MHENLLTVYVHGSLSTVYDYVSSSTVNKYGSLSRIFFLHAFGPALRRAAASARCLAAARPRFCMGDSGHVSCTGIDNALRQTFIQSTDEDGA